MPPFITSVVLVLHERDVRPDLERADAAVMSSVTVASAGLRMNAFSLGACSGRSSGSSSGVVPVARTGVPEDVGLGKRRDSKAGRQCDGEGARHRISCITFPTSPGGHPPSSTLLVSADPQNGRRGTGQRTAVGKQHHMLTTQKRDAESGEIGPKIALLLDVWAADLHPHRRCRVLTPASHGRSAARPARPALEPSAPDSPRRRPAPPRRAPRPRSPRPLVRRLALLVFVVVARDLQERDRRVDVADGLAERREVLVEVVRASP
jgi:hypothetical protein